MRLLVPGLVVAITAALVAAHAAEPIGGTAAAPAPFAAADGSLAIRVGLETDLDSVSVPCCETVWIEHGGARAAHSAGIEVRPGGRALEPTYRLQAAAIKDEDQAHALALTLERRTGAPASASFDVVSGLYRVRFGRYDSREAAERSRQRLADHGLAASWVVKEGGGVERPALVTVAAGESREAPGRWLSIEPSAQAGVRVERGRFRGRLLVYLNDRGLLNLINELPLEDYLRGVVPMEMGPELYDSLDSLKAQAVAARTFAVRSLGGFAAEGFDLCASPRCQAYGGLDSEHPLSDRAVGETAGEIVLHDGVIAEALYSASCGGRTEDVKVVFPRKDGGHLQGVACPERGTVRIGSSGVAAGTRYPRGVLDLLAAAGGRAVRGAATPASARGHQASLEALIRSAGLPVADDALASLDRAEVRRYLASALDLALDARVLRAPAPEPDPAWSAAERRLHARLTGGGARASSHVSTSEMEELELEVALLLGVAIEERAYFLDYGDRVIAVREAGVRRELALASPFATFERRGAELVAAPVALAPGDRLRLVRTGDRVLAVASDREGPSAPLAAPEPWTVWKSEDELRRSVATLYPGFALRDFEIVERGDSGRVSKLRLLGRAADTVVVEGLAVRWTLGTPETWFDARREVRGGQPGWVLEGRGRGHGVGLCQLGAVAMSRRGHTYKEILAHYYAGARLGRLRPHRPEPPAGASQTGSREAAG